MSLSLELFYIKRLGNRVYCKIVFRFFVLLFLKRFFLHMVLSDIKLIYTDQIPPIDETGTTTPNQSGPENNVSERQWKSTLYSPELKNNSLTIKCTLVSYPGHTSLGGWGACVLLLSRRCCVRTLDPADWAIYTGVVW